MSDAVNLSPFVTPEWTKNFLAALEEHPNAAQSLEILEMEGMSRADLFYYLAYYSHPASEHFERHLRSWAKDTEKLAEKAERNMQKLVDRLRSKMPQFELGQTAWTQYQVAIDTYGSLKAAVEQTDKLRRHYKRLSSQQGKARDEESLVWLCLSVEAATGRQHWEDLAYLLEVSFLANGQNQDWNEDSLRKIVERFRKAHPMLYGDMMGTLFEGAPVQRPIVVKRSTRNRKWPGDPGPRQR